MPLWILSCSFHVTYKLISELPPNRVTLPNICPVFCIDNISINTYPQNVCLMLHFYFFNSFKIKILYLDLILDRMWAKLFFRTGIVIMPRIVFHPARNFLYVINNTVTMVQISQSYFIIRILPRLQTYWLGIQNTTFYVSNFFQVASHFCVGFWIYVLRWFLYLCRS